MQKCKASLTKYRDLTKPRTPLLPCRQWNHETQFASEFFKYDHRPSKPVTFAISFSANIYTKRAPPNITFGKKDFSITAKGNLFLPAIPSIIIFIHPTSLQFGDKRT